MAKAKSGGDDKKKKKALFKAIQSGDTAEVGATLAGLDINASIPSPDGWDMTPLSHALRLENVALARWLLDAGADPTRRNGNGTNALHYCDDTTLAQEMVRRGLPVDERDEQGITPLMNASWSAALGVVEVLLRNGADPNVTNAKGEPLVSLVENDEVRALLVRHGARVPVRSNDGHVLIAKEEPMSPAALNVERGMLGADSEGNIWLSGVGGFCRYDGRALTRLTFEERLSVSSVEGSEKGVTYFATNMGLLRYRGGVFTLFSKADSALPKNRVKTVCSDGRGRLYLILEDETNLAVFDGTSFRVLRGGEELPEDLPELTCLAIDAEGGLILGTEEGFVWNRHGEWERVERLRVGDTTSEEVKAIAVAGTAVYFATDDGVYVDRGGALSLIATENDVSCLCADGDALWIGEGWGGLSRLRGDRVEKHFGADDSELPHDNVWAIARAADGSIWVAAGSGVAMVRGDVLSHIGGK